MMQDLNLTPHDHALSFLVTEQGNSDKINEVELLVEDTICG
jgi:hypothetical protein